MTTIKDFYGKTLFLIFECVWLEDGENPEYSFIEGFDSLEEAKISFNKLEKINKYLCEFNELITFKVNYDEKSYPLFWKPEFNSWVNKGSFMAVTPEEIVSKCKLVKNF